MTITRQILGRVFEVVGRDVTLTIYAGTPDETQETVRATSAMASAAEFQGELSDRDWIWTVNGRGQIAAVAHNF